MKENETLLMDIGKIITSIDEGYLFPSIRLHGDLKFDNILLNSNKYYLIDLESSSEFVFFYDIFNLLTVGAGDGDFSYLKHYIEGAYDGLMEKLFISFNMKYNTNHRHYYFAVYLVELLLHDLNYSAKQIHYEIMLDNFRFLLMKIRTIGCPYFDFVEEK
jgi:thiamine kinase-like enzyme